MKQPSVLFLLGGMQLCKYFSHFGMRSILILYLVDVLNYSDSRAFGINALFIGLVELSGIFGGMIADRLLGLRRAFMLGAALLSIGYSLLIFEGGFFLSLGVIFLGAALFSSNVIALLGKAYQGDDDMGRKKGFSLFYRLQNMGPLISTGLCSLIAVRFGYRAGFATAASGMVAGCAVLFIKRDLLRELGVKKHKQAPSLEKKMLLLPVFGLCCLLAIPFLIAHEKVVLPVLPWVTVGLFLFFSLRIMRHFSEKKSLLWIYLGAQILFFAAEDQLCSTLLVFSEREANLTLFGFQLPSGFLLSLNPVVVLLLGPLLAKMRFNLLLPFLIVAVSFAFLHHLSFAGMIIGVSLAELMVGPAVYDVVSQSTIKGKEGLVTGMIPIASSLAVMLGGGMSKCIALDGKGYEAGFEKAALFVAIGGIFLQLIKIILKINKEQFVKNKTREQK